MTNGHGDVPLLSPEALAAERDPGRCGYLLRVYVARLRVGLLDLAQRLACDPKCLSNLWLARRPRSDMFASDVRAVAEAVGCDRKKLMVVLLAAELLVP